tara:strand:+ start:541 stop:1281 length:741 start_codon:yes stop_codon:yes gene_type:complete
MGILDNATNNIIVDAVLTDLGRMALSRNDGSFAISRFALGDDEVDYGIITRFGRTVGKEKVAKNTPIQEANTNSSVALMHPLVSLRAGDLSRVPIIQLEGSDVTQSTATNPTPGLTVNKNKSTTLTLNQTIINESSIIPQLVDASITVEVDNRFLTINNSKPSFIDTNNVATYNVVRGRRASVTAKNGAVHTLQVSAKAISQSLFTTFGNVGQKTKITTFLKVIGKSSGAMTFIEVTINQNTPAGT